MLRLSYVVPIHNEERILERNVHRLAERLRDEPNAHIVLVENGSQDASWAIAEELATRDLGVPITAHREPVGGLGYAYERALREVLDEPGDVATKDHWILLGAADLPFGFTDLDGALRSLADGTEARVLLGSKAHPDSDILVTPKRRVASIAYRLLRRIVLGMRVADCQGSTFIRADLAAELRPRVHSRDYFYTTELVFLAEHAGAILQELPVALAPDERKSTVSLLSDGFGMGLQLVSLSAREGRIRR